jgi:hypothetical protein
VADVDCTADGKSLCSKHSVRGYPTVMYGPPDSMSKYTGGRDFASLEKFAGEVRNGTAKPGPKLGPNSASGNKPPKTNPKIPVPPFGKLGKENYQKGYDFFKAQAAKLAGKVPPKKPTLPRDLPKAARSPGKPGTDEPDPKSPDAEERKLHSASKTKQGMPSWDQVSKMSSKSGGKTGPQVPWGTKPKTPQERGVSTNGKPGRPPSSSKSTGAKAPWPKISLPGGNKPTPKPVMKKDSFTKGGNFGSKMPKMPKIPNLPKPKMPKMPTLPKIPNFPKPKKRDEV